MNSVDEAILKAVLNLLDGLESAVRRAREEIARVVEESLQWRVIQAPKPVSAEDRAIRWLERKLSRIKAEHPSLKYEFTKDSEGLITALRYRPENEETDEDVKAVAEWAFQKASQRPAVPGSLTPNFKGG